MPFVHQKLASVAAKALFYSSLIALAVWLFWYGQHHWGEHDCMEPASQARNQPPYWSTNVACALDWAHRVFTTNLGFLFLAPAVAALAAVILVDCRDPRPLTAAWSCTQLPPQRFWLGLCGGLSIKDGLVVAAWVAYNAAWYAAIVTHSVANAAHSESGLTARHIGSTMASLISTNLIPLLFPVSRGSVICNALGISYPEGVRWHRWVGQWVLLLACGHGIICWFSWVAMGTWLQSAAQNKAELSNLFGGVALIFSLLLWVSAQGPVRRRFYSSFTLLHHVGFWGFIVMGCAHTWWLFWYFVPGMLLYAVDGVFRLYQATIGRGGSLSTGQQQAAAECCVDGAAAAARPKPGLAGVNAEVLQVDVAADATMCSLLLAAPEFGVAPAGIVWLCVPAVSLTEWHAYTYTGSQVTVTGEGRIANGFTAPPGDAEGQRKVALSVHIKAYSRWSKTLLSLLAQNRGRDRLAVRIQGPYADPPAATGQPDGVIIVAGGIGIASALPVLEELGSLAAINTRGLPTLLLWVCRQGCEFEFMAAPLLAAATALGLNLTFALHITGTDADSAKFNGSGTSMSPPDAVLDTSDAMPSKDQNKKASALVQIGSAGTASSSESARLSEAGPLADESKESAAAAAAAAVSGDGAANGPDVTSMCPVVVFASFAAQLSFKVVLHLAVFGGFLLGLFIATYVGAAMPAAAGNAAWPTSQLGPALVLIPIACALVLGLGALWVGLYIQRLQAHSNNKNNATDSLRTPGAATGSRSAAAAVAAMSGRTSHFLPASKDTAATPQAALLLQVPTLSGGGAFEVLPVAASRPCVSGVVQSWLRTLQQLPGVSAASAKDANDCSTASKHPAGRLHCVVYGCGPTTLDNDVQLAVAAAAAAAKHRRRQEGGGTAAAGCQITLQFVRKTQML